MAGKKAVVRNGYLPERDVFTAAGPVSVKVPKVRDRSGTGVKFNSTVVPPYVRKSPRVSAALPWLYLKGVSTGDMSEALSVLLGDEAKGSIGQCGQPLEGALGRGMAAVEPAGPEQRPLCVLVGRRHPYRRSKRRR